jgi:hypothetical protein
LTDWSVAVVRKRPLVLSVLHRHDGHVDECALEVGSTNPGSCTTTHRCAAHPQDQAHSPGCGHPAVPHGARCDDRGMVVVAQELPPFRDRAGDRNLDFGSGRSPDVNVVVPIDVGVAVVPRLEAPAPGPPSSRALDRPAWHTRAARSPRRAGGSLRLTALGGDGSRLVPSGSRAAASKASARPSQ